MKKIPLLILFIVFLVQTITFAQEIAISTVFSHGNYDKFKNNIGYEIGYNQLFNSKSKIGVSFSHCFNNTDYNYIFMSDADGIDYYREVKPKNRKLNVSVSYGFNLLKKELSGFYIGPVLGLNYFKINEIGTESAVNENNEYEFKQNYWKTNKLSVGLMIEYSRRIISDNISLFFSTKPELIFYSKFGLDGSSTPPVVGFIQLNLGLKFSKRH